MTSRARYRLGVAVAGLSIVAVVATVAIMRLDQSVAGLVIVIAALWGTATYAADATIRPRAPGDLRGRRATCTTIVCVGQETDDIARASIILSAAIGPTVVVATEERGLLGELESVDVRVHISDTLDHALHGALEHVTTDAVQIVSASAFPTSDVANVAGMLQGDVGWAVGRVAAFNDDAFAPGARALVAATVRSRARGAGLVTWEPDATVVRTDLLRQLAIDAERPRGAWLRALASRGYTGVEVPTVVTRRAVPTDAPSFWPSESMRRRAAAADLADAIRSGPLRTRLLTVGGLARELYAYQLLLWLLAPIAIAWVGTFPFACAAAPFFALHGVLALARWSCTRACVGERLHPADDLRAVVYDVPGSFLALPSAVTRRIRQQRIRFPEQPLLVAAGALTLAVAVPLIDRPATAENGVDSTVAVTLLCLAAFWVTAVHAVGPRAWTRGSYRLGFDVPAKLNGRDARAVDASPSGLALVGPFEDVGVGEQVSIFVTLPADDTTIAVTGTVAARRSCGEKTIVGVALALDTTERTLWVRGMVSVVDVAPDAARTRARRASSTAILPSERARRALRGVQLTFITAISAVVLGLLALVVIGYQPLVVRSGSMEPTLAVGDIVITDWVRATEVSPGNIVSFNHAAHDGDSVTHRVRSISANDDQLDFETRGDANNQSEFWSMHEDRLVRRAVGTVPGIGNVMSRLGGPAVRWSLFAVAATVMLATSCAALARTKGASADAAPPQHA